MNSQVLSTDARTASALLLKEVLLENTSLAQSGFYFQSLSPKDKSFAQAICYGVCRYYFSLDAHISKRLQKKLKEKDYDIYAVLLSGCYQLLHMRTPEHAAISSSVETCRRLKKVWACKLVNAILRNIQRSKKDEQAWQEEVENFSNEQKAEHPSWLIEKLQKNWPENHTRIIQANNLQAPMCLRLNPEINSSDYQAELSKIEIDSEQCELAPQALRLTKAVNFETLPQVEEGLVSVQDEAAQLAAHILSPKQGEYILDACAAPGGKTCHLLELAEAEVLALDIDAQRCEKIEENLERLNLQAAIQVADAADTQSWWDKREFDAILLDAPCSATGVIRRHPDIKLLRRDTDIAQLVKTQKNLLENLWSILKPGGRLLYATCSVLKQENEQQIEQFLKQQSTAKSVTIDVKLADNAQQLKHGLQIFPMQHGPDGFYYALLEKSL